MHRSVKRLTVLILVPVFFLVAAGFWYLSRTLPLGTGHTAKTICSNVFVAGRNAETVYKEDIAPIHLLFSMTGYTVDYANREVISTALGMFHTKAVYRDGCGCTLETRTTGAALRNQNFMKTRRSEILSHRGPGPWPAGTGGPPENLPEGIDGPLLEKAIDEAFMETDPDKPKKTRAVVVIHGGELIAERYAPGVDASTPLLGWSMSKSVTNAFVGILVRRGKLDLDSTGIVSHWQTLNDSRNKITLNHLMQMNSGLEFEEAYEPFSSAVEMFYNSYDFASYAAAKPLEAPPGAKWSYSSGTANIIAKIVRETAAGDYSRYYDFLYEEFFDKIGMHSAVFEPDPSGTFVGSSYMFATARDWARFGQLYLQDGIWNSERILPEGWVHYSTTPVETAPQGRYGAMFWLNAGSPDNPADRFWPAVSADAYCAKGFQGQRVIVLPSKDLVLVRIGNCAYEEAWDDERFINDVTEALP